jgi:hypothetical protein
MPSAAFETSGWDAVVFPTGGIPQRGITSYIPQDAPDVMDVSLPTRLP